MFKSILLLCVGNICRSPIAEYVLREAVEHRGFDIAVTSAGLRALVGESADPHSVSVARQHGLDIEPHRAQQLTERHLKDHELILVMESWQQQELESRYPFARGRIHLLGKWNKKQIVDPYGKSIKAFATAYADIATCVDLWCEKIWSK